MFDVTTMFATGMTIHRLSLEYPHPNMEILTEVEIFCDLAQLRASEITYFLFLI